METLTTIIASLSLGGLLVTLLQAFLQNKSRVSESEFKIKETRYKAIIILMWTCLKPKSELKHLRYYREDISDTQMLYRELKLELYYALLYASDGVIKSLREFIDDIDHKNYSNVVLEMRRDLYGKKTEIDFNDIEIQL